MVEREFSATSRPRTARVEKGGRRAERVDVLANARFITPSLHATCRRATASNMLASIYRFLSAAGRSSQAVTALYGVHVDDGNSVFKVLLDMRVNRVKSYLRLRRKKFRSGRNQ